jgi:hypothetical protein
MNRRSFLSVIPLLIVGPVGPSDPIKRVTYSFGKGWSKDRMVRVLLMNSLYGKLAQTEKYVYSRVTIDEVFERWRAGMRDPIAIG